MPCGARRQHSISEGSSSVPQNTQHLATWNSLQNKARKKSESTCGFHVIFPLREVVPVFINFWRVGDSYTCNQSKTIQTITGGSRGTPSAESFCETCVHTAKCHLHREECSRGSCRRGGHLTLNHLLIKIERPQGEAAWMGNQNKSNLALQQGTKLLNSAQSHCWLYLDYNWTIFEYHEQTPNLLTWCL